MAWKSPEDAMPWVGMYIAVASLICTIAMAADVVRSFWQWKLWFPNKFFTLNASTITIMAIALKLPVDLTTKMSETEDRATKMTGIYFLATMLANFLPSLGLMDDRELLMNIVALGILVITILVNISIQIYTQSISKRFKKVAKVPSSNESSEIKEYTRFVVQIEEDAKLSNKILRNTLHSITKLLDGSEKKEPRHILMFLEKSKGFNGLVEFDNDKVPRLYPGEIHNCWSLVIVTLTATAIALPNIANSHFKWLLASMREGLQIVRHVEECLNTDDEIVIARKSATRVWTEVEVYRSWLEIDIQKMARKGKTSKDILAWLGDEAKKVMEEFMSKKKPGIDQSSYKFILAKSLHRISQTILLHYDEEENSMNDEKLFEWISTIIADIFFACFTNLPRVIKMKCHHHAIEKRGDSIRSAAELLGKSKKILKNLKAHQFPNIDLESMAYIDKWRAQIMNQMPNDGSIPDDGQIRNRATTSANILTGLSSSSESLIVNVM